MTELLPLSVAAPALAALILALIGRRLPYVLQGTIAVGGAAGAFAAVLGVALGADSLAGFSDLAWFGGNWILTADIQAALVLYMDRLSLLMSLLVTGFGSLIVLYSVQYMSHEEDTSRYFAAISFFLAAMLILVLGENLLLLFVGWEGVGLASYLLIGHYWKTAFAPPAAMRAFFFNRVGDLFFLIGVFLLFQTMGTLSLPAMSMQSGVFATGDPAPGAHDQLAWAALFLLGGVFGKSAQMPLHVWLPDAMAGPTPVSALIHAATMVTAGVYLVTRLEWLYALAPAARDLLLYCSLLTLMLGSTLACVQSDIKKVLAYSTLAHLALMFLAFSAGDAPAAMMHLFGHAAFKALLFLAAGSVIYFQRHEQDLRKLRGVLARMPVTRAAFWIGALGATGFVPFLSASFFSKELVMHAVHGGHGPFLYWLVFLAELLGIVYIFRMLGYLESVPGDAHESARSGYVSESGWPIRLVLLGLTVCAPVFGWLSASPGFGGPGLLYGMLAGVSEAPEPGMITVAGNAITGILVGAAVFLGFRRSRPGRGVERVFAPHPPLDRNYYFDELYATLILRPLGWIARNALATVEGPFFAGSLRQAGAASLWISRGLRALQNGYVNQYALIVILTTVAILGALWFKL